MHHRRVWCLCVLAIAALLLSASNALAQGTDLGTLRGAVTDPTGASIPGASVTVTDVSTNISRTVQTNEEGVYELNSLKSGEYKVAVTAPGFGATEISGVQVRTAQTTRADARMAIASASESVVVQAEAPAIQADSPTISGTLTNAQLVQVPRDSRDIYSFLYLNPNITQSGNGGSFKFIGNQSYGASFSLDGQRANGGVFGEPTASQPSLETVGELQVLSNSFTAEYAGIANVRVSTKRGGSDYHGSLFYNNKNSALMAWDLRQKVAQTNFAPTPSQPEYRFPYFNLNEFGGSFSGRVPKVKNTFFFIGYERRMQNSPIDLSATNLPHPSLLAGDFSRMNDANKPRVPAGVSLTADEIAQYTVGGAGERLIRIPQRLISPYTTALVKGIFPEVGMGSAINATNGRLVDYYSNVPGTIRRHLGTVRIDHDISENDQLYVVYNGQGNDQRTGAVVNPFIGLGLTVNERSNHTLSISETHLFSPTLINEVRGGFNSQPWFRRSNQTLRQQLQQIGFSEADISAYGEVIGPDAVDTYGHLAIGLGGTYRAIGNGGRNTYRPLDQNLLTFGDTLTWIKGRHSIKMGADFVRNAAIDGFTSGRGNPRGLITYTGSGPDPLARFLMGLPANSVSFVNQYRPPMDVHNWENGFFILDDFKVHPNVTLNFGLRYEIITPFVEGNDLLVNFDPDFVQPNGRKGRFVVPSEKTLSVVDPRYITYGITTADQIGLPRSLVKTDYNNFAPRFGASWRLTDKTVLRGGYGIFYPTSAAQGIRDPLATNSFQPGLTRTNVPESPLGAWPRPLTGGRQNVLSGLTVPSNPVQFDLQSPRVQQYNVTFERDLGWDTGVRFSYLGTRMSNLISGRDLNLLEPNSTPFGTTTGDGVTPCDPDEGNCDLSPADMARWPYPELGDWLVKYGNVGSGRSHAFQAEVNRRFAGGLTFNASYTLLDQKSYAPDTGNSSLGGMVYNQFRPEVDYGEDAFTSKHRFVTYGVWETPFGRGKQFGKDIPKWLDAVAGGWGVSWQGFAKSGIGITPFWTCENCWPFYPGNIGSSSIDPTGAFYTTGFRPVVTGDPYAASGDTYFTAAAFGLPPNGPDLFDNPNVADRHYLRTPGTFGLNAGLRKYFQFTESIRAELGADFNNVLNHPIKLPLADGDPSLYEYGNIGSVAMRINPNTLQAEYGNVTLNPMFGRFITSYQQEGIDSRRTVRLRLRLTF